MVEPRPVAARGVGVGLRVPDGISDKAELVELISSGQRPSVLMSEREISVLRRGLTKHGWKRAIYLEPGNGYRGIYAASGMLSRANRGLEQSVKIPERGGCSEDFHCECGAPLRIPENLCIAPEYECSVCGRKYSGGVYDGAMRFFQHQDTVGTALALALVYAIERDKAYADKAVEFLLGYADAYSTDRASRMEGRMLAQPADEAACIIALAQAYDLVYYCRTLAAENRKRIEDVLLRRAAGEFARMGSSGPCGSWFLAAAGVVGFALREADLIDDALEGARRQIGEEIGDDGLWRGPLAGTHFRSLSALVHLAEAGWRSGIDLYNWEPAPGRSLRSMFAAPLHCAYPSLRLPAIDADPYDSFLPLDLYEIACRRWDDVGFAWALKKGYKLGESQVRGDDGDHTDRFKRRGFYAFLFGRDLPGRVGVPVIHGRDFPSLGLSTLRTNEDSMATLRWGRSSESGHQDSLSFTFYSNGSLIAPDYGRPTGGGEVQEWSACAAAHNTVLVDGGSVKESSGGTLLSAQHGSYLRYIQAAARDVHSGVEHTRRMVLLDGLCVVADTLTGESEHEYDWIVRCDGEPRAAGRQSNARMEWTGDPHVTIDRVYDLADGLRMDWTGENGQVALAVWHGARQALVGIGSCPAEFMSRRASVVVCRQCGSAAEFVAAFAPSESGDVELCREGRVIKLGRANRTDYVCMGRGDDGGPSERLETDGEAAAVRVCGGRVQCVAVMGGCVVRWDGETMLECPARVDCAQVCFGERSPVVTYQGGIPGTVKIRTSARAMRVNGHRTAAVSSDGQAILKVDSQMLIARGLEAAS
jgi:hypothetical protein